MYRNERGLDALAEAGEEEIASELAQALARRATAHTSALRTAEVLNAIGDRLRSWYPRVYLKKGAAWSGSGYKSGYYYLFGASDRGGVHLADEERVSEPGELAVILGKTLRGGAIWFLSSNIRPVRSRQRSR